MLDCIMFDPFFARESAFSLPLIPQWKATVLLLNIVFGIQ